MTSVLLCSILFQLPRTNETTAAKRLDSLSSIFWYNLPFSSVFLGACSFFNHVADNPGNGTQK